MLCAPIFPYIFTECNVIIKTSCQLCLLVYDVYSALLKHVMSFES